MRAFWLIAGVVGCGSGGSRSPDPIEGDGVPPTCEAGATYPTGAAQVMAVGAVIAPYTWPEAIDRSNDRRLPLDLENVPCNVDLNLDWSPADVLLFVSIPAW